MKTTLFLCALVGVLSLASTKVLYDAKYDHIDLLSILKNDRMLKRYIDCLLDKPAAKCDHEGEYLKEKLPEAIRTDCELCTPKQKIGAYKGIEYLLSVKPHIWDEIQQRFDKENKFVPRNQRQLDYIKTHHDQIVPEEFFALFKH